MVFFSRFLRAAHGHHDHHVEVPKVPDYTIYKIENSKLMRRNQEKLAKLGLKDPWARNQVWRCMLNKPGTNNFTILLDLFTKGWQLWVPLLALTIGLEHYFGIDYHGHSHHDDHGTKSEEHH